MKIYDIRINTACGKRCSWFDLRLKHVIDKHGIMGRFCKLFGVWMLDEETKGHWQCKVMCERIEKEPESEEG